MLVSINKWTAASLIVTSLPRKGRLRTFVTPNVMAMWVALLLHILEAPANLGPEIGFPDSSF
jgi:hypothetical protein